MVKILVVIHHDMLENTAWIFFEKKLKERMSCLTACRLFRVLVAVEASSSSIKVAGVCDTLQHLRMMRHLYHMYMRSLPRISLSSCYEAVVARSCVPLCSVSVHWLTSIFNHITSARIVLVEL